MKNSPRAAAPAGLRRAESHARAGILASRQRQWKSAAAEFEQAAGLAPSDELVWLNLARSRLHLGELDAALAAACRAFQLDRAGPIACRLAAECAIQLQRPAQAAEIFDQLAPEVARDHDFHSAHGNALFLAGRLRDAIDAFFRALALKVDAPLVHYRLGLCFMDSGMALEAAECFRTAVSLDDGLVRALALSLLVHESRQACDWVRVAPDTQALLAAIETADAETGRLLSPFALLAIDATPAQQRRLGERRCEGLAQGVVALPPPGPRRPGPIRVGYLSSDFYEHATSVLMVELLERRDPSRFEVFLYSHGPDDGSDMARRMRAACEHFVDVRAMGHRAIAERMRADGLDIAVDLKGHTRDSRMELLAHRPAPVQACYLGYPATTGATFIDYIIGDRVVTPLAHAADFSERIAQLPWSYQPNDHHRVLPSRPPRAALGLPEDAVVLCCFNQTYKLSPAMLDLWARILARAPRAVLWMLAWNPHARANLVRELAARGVGEERVFFAPKLDLAGHLARLRAADLFLDTWPCNAHTTASEALWAGVPVLTVPGPTFASRVAASLVGACGLADLACADADHYVELAAALANETSTLADLKAHLETYRHQLPLFDAERLARDLDALLLRMHEGHLAGLPPDCLPAA
jgi:predicted O-linked N-acetylglucosamine transferase (SPINDLY family)